ncbi:MAG: hypothetical protein UU67_C0042G0011 [Candidatus Daviesbacteria bacterium GW2011_GWB1_41_5]|uniref:Uncharacterized protein n=1 Tax=Candidatus Daviesbacteria bacterium GW2011_GWB1_41_5 TaxID=1618429 RepID=A0A0G0WIS0_9BACT|nr:MAG: hypothetical protein UU67_C0042G0011 [Candidatus Daviesbacteria bacterium GW2011_GWB1_41_5]
MTKHAKALSVIALGTVFILGAIIWFQYEYSKWEHRQRLNAALQEVYEKAGYFN